MEKVRHENKYIISKQQYEILKLEMSNIIKLDSNAIDIGFYEIRSLYFDDYENSCYFDNENGVEKRKKYRIRIYNGDKKIIMFEIKHKIFNKTVKQQCTINEQQVLDILEGRGLTYDENLDPILKEFYVQQQTKLLKPKIIVEYDRIPYTCVDGNVRITFDMNIRYSNDLHSFLEKKIVNTPIMPLYTNLLEVKFDEFLPSYIYNELNDLELKQIAFSKYYLCRKFGGTLL